MELEITKAEVTCTDPDDDGDRALSAELEYRVSGEGELDLIETRVLLRTADGLPLWTERSEEEDELSDGEVGRLETSDWLQMDSPVGNPAEVWLTGMALTVHDLGSAPLPQGGGITGSADELDLGGGVVIRGHSVRVEPPDDEGDCVVRGLVVLHNGSAEHISRAVVLMEMKKRKGKQLEESEDEERQIPPGATTLIETYTYIQKKWLSKGVTLSITLHLYRAVAHVRRTDLVVVYKKGDVY